MPYTAAAAAARSGARGITAAQNARGKSQLVSCEGSAQATHCASNATGVKRDDVEVTLNHLPMSV